MTRNLSMIVLSLFLCATAFSQESDSTVEIRKKAPRTYRKNVVKINVPALLLKNFSFFYERALTRKISFSAGYRFMPKSNLGGINLVSKAAEKITDDPASDVQVFDLYLKDIEAKNNAVTAEFRFYGGRRPGARGFYFSLYGRYGNYGVDAPYEFSGTSGSYRIPLSTSSKTIAGGFTIGLQWQIAKRVAIDWCILGGHYGSIKGDINGNINLSGMSPADRQQLQNELNDLVSIGKNDYINATVTPQGVTGTIKGPFAGVRLGSLSVGIAF